VRGARELIRDLRKDGKTVKILCIGRKGRDQLKSEFGTLIIHTIEDLSRPRPSYDEGLNIAERFAAMVEEEDFDVCTIIYNRFKSAISQELTVQQLIPFPVLEAGSETGHEENAGPSAIYEFEPDEADILNELLPRNLAVQVFRALLESFASEQGARMAAMDSATRNAGEMIDKLTLNYNRTRQAKITTEMIEIVSGAEAL
jgi:F-type H+-transporting ATPase subunit gamma